METIADRIARLAETARVTRSHQNAQLGSTPTNLTDLQVIETELASFQTADDPVLAKMRHVAARFVRSIRQGCSPCWLTFWGVNGRGNGTGKTHLARLISEAVRMHLPATPPTCFLSWPNVCARKQSGGDVTHKMGFARESGLLIIDDAGAEHQTDWTAAFLMDLLNWRLGRWTIMTTNLSPSQWSARDHRIASRLHRSGSYLLQCETVDWAERKETL